MNQPPVNSLQQKQHTISAGLVVLNIFLGLVYVNCIPQEEDSFFMGFLGVGILAVLLQALFVFTYKGKAPFLSKCILVVLLLATVAYGALICYVIALGKAFQH
ncbi:MAG: hypothetical protein QM687_02390 [Ferruginibacter sp.]